MLVGWLGHSYPCIHQGGWDYRSGGCDRAVNPCRSWRLSAEPPPPTPGAINSEGCAAPMMRVGAIDIPNNQSRVGLPLSPKFLLSVSGTTRPAMCALAVMFASLAALDALMFSEQLIRS